MDDWSKRRGAGRVALALAVLTLTACTGKPAGRPHDVTSSSISAPSLQERCGVDVEGVRSRVITTATQQLYGVEVGRGTRGVVLVHGSGSGGLCNWAAELEWLRDAGLYVLAYDQACVGESSCADPLEARQDLRAAVAELKRQGAVSVIAVGASAGAPLTIELAADTRSGAAAVVALSPVGSAGSGTPRIPLLIAVDPDDTSIDLPVLRTVRDSAPDLVKLEVLRRSGHAQELLYDDGQTGESAFRAIMLAFVSRHGGSRG